VFGRGRVGEAELRGKARRQEFDAGNFVRVDKDRKNCRAAQMVIDKRPQFHNALDADGVMTVTSLFLTAILDFSKTVTADYGSGLTEEPRLSTPKTKSSTSTVVF
jgi:hypothetical protein